MEISVLIGIAQIIVSVLLIIAVLLQNSTAGAGEVFGGGDSSGVPNTRRGAEKQLLKITVVLAIIFALLPIISLLGL